jgi:hypothetical protein
VIPLLLALLACVAGNAGLYVRLRPEFSRTIVLTTVALVTGATSLAWYTFFEPAPVDAAAFALVAWLGVAASRNRAPRSPWQRSALWVGVALVPLVLLQVTAASGGATYRLPGSASGLADVLFSSRHGFLSWTPVAYIAVLGTIAYYRRDRVWAIASLVIVLVTAWRIGVDVRLMTAPGFGARALVAVLALLAPGLALVLDTLTRRPVLGLAPLVIAPIFWNHLLMVQYTIGGLPKDEPVSFARLVRGQADAYIRGSRFYPFAFPANVWFAWREQLPADRYDLLALEPRVPSLDLVMDRRVDKFLLEGWDAPGVESSGPVWWTGGRRATLALPLALPADRAIEIVITARSRFEEPVVEADLVLQVNDHDVAQFAPAAAAPSEFRVRLPASAARVLFREGFNRVSFVSRGVHRADPTDTRPPGPFATRRGESAWPVAIYRITIAPVK